MEPASIAPGIWRVEKPRPSGWTLNMYVLDGVAERGLVLHSPTFVDDETLERVAALGEVRALVLPNHYHWLSAPRYAARFPEAALLAAPRAIPRLQTKLRRAIAPASLASWHACEGVASGEGWILAGDTLVVCDAFMNCARASGFEGMMLRAISAAPGLTIATTFSRVAVGDRRAYRRWACEFLRREQVRRVIFSHGEPLEGDDAGERLATLVEKTFA